MNGRKPDPGIGIFQKYMMTDKLCLVFEKSELLAVLTAI
jgi:hypothetical protein